ncbi:MAG: geranylgeranyl reductase family protein [Nitrospirota bacterium]
MYDVIVAGAGPSGSTCARECARRGLRTLLLDKERFPRPKPCGGALSEQALSYLDFPLPQEIIEKECHGVRVHYKNYTLEVREKHRLAVLISREKFDFLLLEKAVETGVNVLQGERAINLQGNRDYVEVVTEKSIYKTLCVVGADGVNSSIAKHVRPPFTKEEMLFALVSSVPATNEDINKRLDKVIDIHFGLVQMGYGWIFPHNEYYSVGIGALASKFQNPRETFLRFAHSEGLRINGLKGHFIPLGGFKRKLISERIILVGDAAGFVDPFTGEGIAYAILSGKLAARAIINSLENKNYSYLSSYERDCEKLIVRNLGYACFGTRLFHSLPNIFLRLFASDERILKKYLNTSPGKVDYRKFLIWLIIRTPFYSFSRIC